MVFKNTGDVPVTTAATSGSTTTTTTWSASFAIIPSRAAGWHFNANSCTTDASMNTEDSVNCSLFKLNKKSTQSFNLRSIQSTNRIFSITAILLQVKHPIVHWMNCTSNTVFSYKYVRILRKQSLADFWPPKHSAMGHIFRRHFRFHAWMPMNPNCPHTLYTPDPIHDSETLSATSALKE